jgi:hypothetical protein
MAAPPPQLDHLILFLPLDTSSTQPLIPKYFPENFTLTPGGTHADNLTTNTLILLADGCYIELISYIPQTHTPEIEQHWWGPDVGRKGWADWCLTTPTPAAENFEERLGGKEGAYAEPKAGARKRPDGVEVKWAVTFPRGENGGQDKRGRVPFFCHDDPITARHLRVPITEERTKHVCDALGVLSLTVLVRDREMLEATRRVYAGVFGNEGVRGGGSDEVVFEARRVNEVPDLKEAGGPKIILRVAKEEEVEKIKDKGYWFGSVVLGARAWEHYETGSGWSVDGNKGDADYLVDLRIEYVEFEGTRLGAL